MKIEFNDWVVMLKTVIELGKENGYEIYDKSNSGDLRVYKEINKSCKYNNTVFLSYENKEKEKCYLCQNSCNNLIKIEGKGEFCNYCYRLITGCSFK
ncbi:hypothetical protein [Clostridium perfringens]|uniref:hypothetical protein n=1 Tax=Clostridium perfringens TaxID=1502 RepID=UPI00374A76B3